MSYSRSRIYFASGTGNSYRAAAWFHESCLVKGIDSELIPIERAIPKGEIQPSDEQLVVLAFPAHGLMPPWSMIKFILKMPNKQNTRLFSLPTRGSFWIGSLLIPGAAGLGSFLPTLLLVWKGYRSVGATSLDMPVNMTSLHPPLGKASASRLIARTKKIAQPRFERVLSGRSLWFTWNHLWELAWSLPLLILFPLFPLLYLLIGKFFMGKLHFANSNCTGCGACARGCPCSAIKLLGRKKKRRPHWSYHCEACLRCLNGCKFKSVEAGLSWGIILWIVMTMPLGIWLYPLVEQNVFGVTDLNWFLRELVFCVYYYPAVIISYWIFSFVLRCKPINWIFTHTSVSHYFGRYLEPAYRRRDLLRGQRLKSSHSSDLGN